MENQKKRILLSAKELVNCYREIKEIMSHSSKKSICEKVANLHRKQNTARIHTNMHFIKEELSRKIYGYHERN
jgi:hypothetical protein